MKRSGGRTRRPEREAKTGLSVGGDAGETGRGRGRRARTAGAESTKGTGGTTASGKMSLKKAGLSRSTETVTVLLFRRISNVFELRERTRKGPSYGGVNGRLTASTRRKTWDARANDGGRCPGSTGPRRTGRRGRRDAMEAAKLEAKAETSEESTLDELAEEGEERRSPGRRS